MKSRLVQRRSASMARLPIDPRDRGLTLGDGLFETMLVVNRTPLWANMHLARMEGVRQGTRHRLRPQPHR